MKVAELTCAWRPLIVIGMFGMTISSTMTNMDQGPQNLQAACKDAILPYMRYFAKEFGRNRFPRRAYVFLAMLTMLLTLIGKTRRRYFCYTVLVIFRRPERAKRNCDKHVYVGTNFIHTYIHIY